MRRRKYRAAAWASALVATALLALPGGALATPVATTEAQYEQFGRVFPDPHGCSDGAPATSPWAKGNVCAFQFIQWSEAIRGLQFLEDRFGRYMEVMRREELREVATNLTDEELRSAGLPQENLRRQKRNLHVIKVTDSQSDVPEDERKHFTYVLSIHGIERAGAEGGIRAIEDLVTWSACEEDEGAAPACGSEGPFPKRILEPSNSGPTAGQVLREAVIYFVLANPDGWHRGEFTDGGVFFQRYNGNGMDLNRDWPTVGYTEEQYTPLSEPETRGYAKFLAAVSEQTAAGRFAGGIDLHGMLTAPSFSFTLLGAGQRDLRKNELTVDTSIKTFRDSEVRLSWSPLIAPAEQCPGPVTEPAFGGNVPMCSDQWGTVWDTIDYQITGGFGDWIESPLGLNGVGIANEMALSHLTPNTVFDPQVEQLHIDGNKGLIYSQLASLVDPEKIRFVPDGRVAYVFDPERISHPGGGPPEAAPEELPPQPGFERMEVGGQGFDFRVKGPPRFRNGGLTIEATAANARGISTNNAPGIVSPGLGTLILDYCGPSQHPGDPSGECREIARYFNQSGVYLQAGARIDLNDPPPGRYRIRSDMTRTLPTRFKVRFHPGKANPVPEQAPYDVSRMDFFRDLNRYIPEEHRLDRLRVGRILADPGLLDGYDTLIVANDFMPGFSREGESRYTRAEFREYAAALASFAREGGNLTLTDAAMSGLPPLDTGLFPGHVHGGHFYAGWMDFNDTSGPTYGRHALAEGVNMEGTAEGQAEVDGRQFQNRHQTYEPVPLGYHVSASGPSNADCSIDRCDSPNWIVNQKAWEEIGGTTAARTLIRATPRPGSRSRTGVSLGELPFGEGVIRIAGALLPDPTEANYHPYGLFSYALTYTGYEVFENLLEYRRPG